MCGRYYSADEDASEELERLVAALQKKMAERGEPTALKTRGEVFPGDLTAVVANSRQMRRAAFAMRWGMPRPSGKGFVINARSETAARSPMFREGMRAHRCLVPAGGYFEWHGEKGHKTKYLFTPSVGRVFYMAGVYAAPPELPYPAFAILTRNATQEASVIHDRMPVVLPESEIDAWLDISRNAQSALANARLDFTFAEAAEHQGFALDPSSALRRGVAGTDVHPPLPARVSRAGRLD